jgi:hypothetical protein
MENENDDEQGIHNVLTKKKEIRARNGRTRERERERERGDEMRVQ